MLQTATETPDCEPEPKWDRRWCVAVAKRLSRMYKPCLCHELTMWLEANHSLSALAFHNFNKEISILLLE